MLFLEAGVLESKRFFNCERLVLGQGTGSARWKQRLVLLPPIRLVVVVNVKEGHANV